ncbi:tRNA (adenosine(37)-N6)-dimethylallyltransferase MiaA [Sphingomonas sp. So64.6b]|uniref:tRNA (adenosine(37)-N6)-dimethylallyltransferase MiaA n=1 Tax=Sphingomonas sp. So64.6b TaxID=2997354 RepID=UPI0016024072|nr:tRNA (adenosine(37)-N6)-dimethylallyltransferase MiaA [Sphingomonas sp. So64.6b]QNA84150.1 tRNA (adenosine(37)-N6)-dimethylallyltransferase MiaA [Sphingomonas sp. So64.6b]
MNIENSLSSLALIAGPTASGKSALAMMLAERHDGVVINADSAQVYADLRILSARPTVEEEARVEHRLFGYVDGAESSSAAHWAADARHVIAETHAAGRLPVLVGGTGLHIRTLLDGIAPVPPIDPAIREAIRALPVAQAYRLLAEADPDAARRLAPADTTRVARALEVVRSTGRPLADWQRDKTGGIGGAVRLTATILLPNREWLLDRCDTRLAWMFDHGAIAEVEALLARPDIPPLAPVRRAIGVPEIAALLTGEIDRDEALARARLATRQYAKRQFTWFRNQPPAMWPRLLETDSNTLLGNIETRLRS